MDWAERPVDSRRIDELIAAGLSRLQARLLASRGVTAETLASYLKPELAGLAKPEELPGVVEATDVILEVVAGGGRIVVFGDYDCDGVCATAIMVRCLRAIHPSDPDDERVVPFLPRRLNEGYGVTDASMARMLREYPDVKLVITVDNGINSVEQVAALKRAGIKVVVTDHHLPGSELPEADALVDTKVSAPPGLEWLCGAGVAFFLANRIVSEARRRGLYDGPCVAGPLLILAGLATVTDIMPLAPQNRILVAEALARFHRLAPRGLKDLLDRAAKSAVSRLVSKDFGFMIGPRINAAGRMDHEMDALDLVLADDPDISREYARMVDGYNIERKVEEQKMSAEAWLKVVPEAPAQVIELPDGHPGIAGIVAARVLERLGGTAPVLVVAKGHGSARSPCGINVRDAMSACGDLLTRFGGHAAAGGFSVKPGKIDEFREKLCDYCRRKIATDPVFAEAAKGIHHLDAWVGEADLTLELAEWISQMEPFGEGNEEPKFGLRNVHFSEIRPLGSDGRHLLVSFRERGLPSGVWWNHGDLVEELRAGSAEPADVVFNLGVSDYGSRHVELRVVSIERGGDPVNMEEYQQ